MILSDYCNISSMVTSYYKISNHNIMTEKSLKKKAQFSNYVCNNKFVGIYHFILSGFREKKKESFDELIVKR